MIPAFTSIISQLQKIDREEAFDYDDMQAFGAPSECGSLISASADRRRSRVLEEAGVTPADLRAEIKRRGVSGKWMHFNGPALPEDERNNYRH